MRPAPISPGRLPPGTRARVIHEILAAYIPLMRLVRTNDLPAMMVAARTPTRTPVPVSKEMARETAVRLGAMTERVLALLPTDKRCLITSLVVLRLLTHREIPARVVIGVKDDDGFAAHAWVEHEEIALSPTNGFTPLTEM